MFRSATLRLTLWYIILATCLSLLFSAVVYRLSTEELREALTHQYNSLIDNDHDHDNVLPPSSGVELGGRHLLDGLVWFNVAVISGSSIFGYLLARRTLRPIRSAHQAQTRFTAEASHELRTPLAAIRADTEVALMEKGVPAKTRRTLRGNLRDIERLEHLTANLLDIEHYHNKKTSELALLDFDEIVRNDIVKLGRAARNKNIHIKQDIHPVQVMGEEHSLRQLVTIVLDNAIKYSHPKGAITVSLHISHGGAVLTIDDDGIGIPSDDLPHVFERFYRSSKNKLDQKSAHGYGLGLALAQEIVDAYHGDVHITSREDNGTTVRITLPHAHS